jgi:hypothetical protein
VDAIFNAQVGMAVIIIVILLIVYVVIVGWTRRLSDRTADPKMGPPQAGRAGQESGGELITQAEGRDAAAARESRRKKKQVLIQGKDAEIAASVLRRMLSDHGKS